MDIINITTTIPTQDNFTQSSKCLVDRHESIIAMKAIIMVASSLSILGALSIILVSYCKRESQKKRNFETEAPLQETAKLLNPETVSCASTQTNDTTATDYTIARMEERKGGSAVHHPARLILMCISAADILVAISHIWGVTNNYVNLQHTSIAYTHGGANDSAESTECGAQAVLAIFGAISSFLWSDLLAFMAVVMLRSSKKWWFKPANFISYRAFVIYNIICWGIPLLIVCVLGGTNAIGFEEGVDVGWCYIHAHYDKKGLRLWWMFFSYEIWATGSMLWIIVLVIWFCITLCADRLRKKRAQAQDNAAQEEERRQLTESDHESVAVHEDTGCCWRCSACRCCSKPLIMIIAAGSLVVCRVWATSLDVLLFRSITERSSFHCTLTNLVILTFAGFGNSSQGLVNFFIFIVFTGQCCKIVRDCACRNQYPLP